MRILSIGGGIDTAAIYLAKQGNYVDSTDTSEEAVSITARLAQQLKVEKNLNTYLLNWEKDEIDKKFEVVILHEVLHHMDIPKAVTKIHDVLEEGGYLIALEPVCLANIIRFFHQKLPFHPAPFVVHPEGEIDYELQVKDLNIIKKKFGKTTFYFFDALNRESTYYFLYKTGLCKVIKALGRVDYYMIKLFPFLKYLSSYVVWKSRRI